MAWRGRNHGSYAFCRRTEEPKTRVFIKRKLPCEARDPFVRESREKTGSRQQRASMAEGIVEKKKKQHKRRKKKFERRYRERMREI